MHRPTTALLLALLTLTAALPLNINLGAYSPALVVGDGAISFEGAEEGAEGTSAAQLVNALQGAAVGTAAGAGAAGAGRTNAGITVNAAAAGGDGPGVVQAAAAPRPILNDPVCCYSLSFVLGPFYFVGAGCWGVMSFADAEGGDRRLRCRSLGRRKSWIRECKRG